MSEKLNSSGSRKQATAGLRSHLEDLLTLRSQGLLTQSEYQEKLDEIGQSLPRKARLAEYDLPRGVTRFVLREIGAGRILGEFAFLHGHPVDG